jgi:hypothetical protein
MGNYQDLLFYQKARQVVKDIDALIKTWPKTMQAQEISRSSISTIRSKQGTKNIREDQADYFTDC